MTDHPRHRVRPSAALALALLLAAVLAPAVASRPAAAVDATVSGVVRAGGGLLDDYEVTLVQTGRGAIGSATSGPAGAFSIGYVRPTDPAAVLYLVAENPADPPLAAGTITLASVLGQIPVPQAVVITERTTVAAGFGMAQFTDADGQVGGTSPGLQNAAGMTLNLADAQSGGVGTVLDSTPNGGETEARRSFNSLANMVSACVESPVECAGLFAAATPPGGAAPANTFTAMGDIARNPGRSEANVAALFAVSELGSKPNQPARVIPPDAWTMALRFNGDGNTLSGPGNFAIDHEGNLWVSNNYQYTPDATTPVCGSDLVMKFDPTGQYVPGSPYSGGGLSGAGFGVDIDPYGDVWVGNFGFAAPPPGCPVDQQPPRNSVSQLHPDGTPVSPATGWTQGGISGPQGTVSDDEGNIWIANCSGNTVTVFPDGDPSRAREITDLGLTDPFAIAHAANGDHFVTGIRSDNVARLRPDGTPYPNSPISGPFDKPFAIAADSQDNMWVTNSTFLELPCPKQGTNARGGSLARIDADGTTTAGPIEGGGLKVPWGIAVDSKDNLWIANFAGKRLSHFCGIDTSACPPGVTTGKPISGDDGYGFDGLVRSTGVAVDQAGNVWLTNNWKEIPLQTNPGGYEIVAYVGLAAPVDYPAPRERPKKPAPTPDQPAGPALPVRAAARFTG